MARGLSRHFGEVVAVDDIDLDVPAQQIYGFLGPNGSGKSTTIRMMCGLLKPTAGSVTVLGRDALVEAESVRLGLGYMTQRFSLWDDLSVRENLRFMCSIYGLSAAERRARVAAATGEYRLGEFAGRLAGTLSGGQRQRLALAAATLHRPRILLLDEPTSAVDPQSRRDFWEKLFELVARGATVLVSTHYMDEAERCHRLAILDRGRVVAEGPPKQLARDIDAAVVEVECADLVAARAALSSEQRIVSIAQLGSRLHVLLDRSLPEPEGHVSRLLAGRCANAVVERVPASLEDVFVAATSGRGRADEATERTA